MKVKWKAADTHQLRITMLKAAENRSEEAKAFLKVWVGQWLGKWRERVRLFQRMPKRSKRHFRSLRKAKKVYKEIKKRQELKRLIVQKLISQGEVCMAGLIAENLIIEEIARQLTRGSGKKSMKNIGLNPAEILPGVLSKAKTLSDRKTPLIYLKIMLGNWNT